LSMFVEAVFAIF